MWCFIFTIFLLVRGSLGEADCSVSPFELCSHPKLLSSIPKTIPEYNKLCPDLPKYLRCLKEFEKTCGTVVFFDSEDEYENLHDFYSELCDEGSLLNTIITENLKCLNETFGASHCSDETQSFLHQFKALDVPSKEEDQENILIELECLKSIYDAACITNDISRKCGSIVKETAYEVIRRSNYIEYNCPSTFVKRLLDDPKVIGLQTKYKDFFYSLMGKYADGYDSGSGLL